MAKVLISEKYLHDIANAIRVKLDSQSVYTPVQMAAAIADITGSISGTITPSTDTDKVLVTDSNLMAIAAAIRSKLGVATNYTPAQMADAILSIQAAGPTIVSWASGSDAEIGAMIDAAQAGIIDLQQDGGWAIGDVRTITVGAFTDGKGVSHPQQEIDIVLSSFDEYMECGNVLQFDFKDGVSGGIRMNRSDTNYGGYGESEMKTTTLPAFVEVLPNWLQSHLIEFSVLASEGDASANIETVTSNLLALRSEIEVIGAASKSYAGEGALIPYYGTASNRIKKDGKSGADAAWRLRSCAKNSTGFVYIGVDGQSSNYSAAAKASASNSVMAPFGCL